MNNYLLVINAGSSSIKFAVYQRDVSSNQLVADATGQIEGIGNQPKFAVKDSHVADLVVHRHTVDEIRDHASAISIICSWLKDYFRDSTLLAVGHRVVHGGQHYSIPVLIDAKVLNDLENLISLAPLHQPHSLAAIRAFQEIMPTLPQVACFDTAFHRT
jgi:acetate kinase